MRGNQAFNRRDLSYQTAQPSAHCCSGTTLVQCSEELQSLTVTGGWPLFPFSWLNAIAPLGLTEGGVGPLQGGIAERPLCVISDCCRLFCVISPATGSHSTESSGSYLALLVAVAFTAAVSKGSTPHWRSWFLSLWPVLHLAFIPEGPSQRVTVHPNFPHTALR